MRLCFQGASDAVKDSQTVDVSAKLSTDGREKASSEQLLVDETTQRGTAQTGTAPKNRSFSPLMRNQQPTPGDRNQLQPTGTLKNVQMLSGATALRDLDKVTERS